MRFHFEKVEDLAGFVTENAKPGEILPILTRARLTSADPEFYVFSEHITNVFLGPFGFPADWVYQLLVVIHAELSADVYVNEIRVDLEIMAKGNIEPGLVNSNNIADIRRVKFPETEIKDTDRVIYCFKVGWRFGLFFDLTAHPAIAGQSASKLDLDHMERSLGDLRRYLMFYHVYKVLEAGSQFEAMLSDGWFPFIELIAGEFRTLSDAYKTNVDLEKRTKAITDGFNDVRVRKITETWWGKPVFAAKRPLLEAGINAYLQNNQDGFINCIKNLWTEIEGILRKIYHEETGKGSGVKSHHLIAHIIDKAKQKTGSEDSLLFPLPFLEYLRDVVFANFNVETGDIDMSRHTSSHGVADPAQYTKERALQTILILDQIYFYC